MRRNRWMIGIVVLLGAGLILPSLAFGQDSGGTLRTPRYNVTSGALASNRPGTWTQAAEATHIERQQAALKDYGGATYQGPEQYTSSRRTVFLLALVESVFQVLNDLVDQLTLALQATQATS